MAEKSVIASISQAEERHFKTLQLPALRAVVSEPAPQKRRFFLLLFLSSSANSQNEAQTRSKRVGVRMAAALSGKRAHSGSHGQTGAIFSSFCLSANRPPKVGPGFRPDLRPAYSRTRCLPLRRRSQRSKVGLNIRRDVALCTVRKWEFPILLYMDPTLNRVGRFCDVSSKIKFIYILHLKER